jgi:RNA polymerase sigma-70 factor (ECF subfamily)
MLSNPDSSKAIPLSAETLLVRRIRDGDERAWELLIAKYQGRLHAFVSRKLHDASAIDDVVQETFLGFHLSLPHFDETRSIESYLFAICGFKVTDHLRRSKKIPPQELLVESPDRARMVSSLHRSREQKKHEEALLTRLLSEDIQKWKSRQDWTKLMCIELLFTSALPNKAIAEKLGLTEQKVANYKSDYLIRVKNQVSKI